MHRGRPFWLQAFRKSKHPLTWLSMLVMGSGCFRFRQFGKGLLYLLSELAFFRFFFGFGWKYLSHFDTLGENAQLKVWNEDLQIYQRVPGDNSMLILLFSVLTIAGTILFVYLWYLNLKSAGELCLLDAQGKHIPSFREDLRSLLDSRFHITLLALILVYSGGAALNYYIAKGFFDTIPKSLDEAAMLDGATQHIIFWKIILPNSKPIVANIAINAFIAPWVDFIFVSVIMKDNYNNYTVAKGLYTMVDKANIFEYYTAFCAGAVLISIPIVLVFIRLQKYYVGGVTAGSSKG